MDIKIKAEAKKLGINVIQGESGKVYRVGQQMYQSSYVEFVSAHIKTVDNLK